MAYRLETSALPIVRLFTPTIWSGTEEIDRLFDEIRAMQARNEPYVFVVIPPPDAKLANTALRSHFAACEQNVMEATRRLCMGSLIVLPNIIARGALTALQWARGKQAFVVETVKSEKDADERAQQLIAAHASTAVRAR